MTKILFSDSQPPRARPADRDQTVREALALLPAKDAAEIVAEARRHALAGTLPEYPERTGGDAIRVPPTWVRDWNAAKLSGVGRWLVPLHVARWCVVSALVNMELFDEEPSQLLEFCKGYQTIRAAIEAATVPGARLGWALTAFYGPANADRFHEALAPLPVAIADAIADEALRIMEAEALPEPPDGALEGPVAILSRWRCAIVDALLHADLDAVRAAVANFGNILGAAGARLIDPRSWTPLAAVPFMEVEA